MSENNSTTSARTGSSILGSLEAALGPELVAAIRRESRVLLVGAGGIGCELLKNLALTGFRNVEVIDLDTIDVSNLNRQLLFRSHHVGQSKCQVACQVAAGLAIAADEESDVDDGNNNNDDSAAVSYRAHHGNVCDNSQFNVQYVRQFDLVLNALDNVAARRRVNRLALAAGAPLIEAGTTGYLGQVVTIHRSSGTACYECQTQETAKVYPVCTIRSTPSAPVHCIVWAKELYKLLFGGSAEESMLYEGGGGSSSPPSGGGEETKEAEQTDETNGDGEENGGAAGTSTYMPAVTEFRALLEANKKGGGDDDSGAAAAALAATILRNLFVDEIQKQLDMDRYKTARQKPVALADSVLAEADAAQAPTAAAAAGGEPCWKAADVWTPRQCASEFVACLRDAAASAADAVVPPAFDKDDALAMRLVTAASNLRSAVFGIEPLQSYYSAKGIAGNIIPAISTTNAIVAGLQILQCFQVLKAQLLLKQQKQQQADDKTAAEQELTTLRQHCRYVNCVRNPTRNGLYLTAGELEGPNPKCFVCRKATVPLQLNVRKWNLRDFLDKIVKNDLGFEQPSIAMDETGDIFWEEGEDADDFSVNLPKALPELPSGGIQHGTVIAIEDFTQDLTVEVVVTHVEDWPATEDEPVPDDHKFVIGAMPNKPAAAAAAVAASGDSKPAAVEASTGNGDKKAAAANSAHDDEEDDDDIIEIVSGPSGETTSNGGGTKRAADRQLNGVSSPPAKKRSKPADDVEVIEIDD